MCLSGDTRMSFLKAHANGRNKSQKCWELLAHANERRRLSKETKHSGTVILKKDCNAHAQTFSRDQHCYDFIACMLVGLGI